jgi:DNA polymerase I-like protein with 3'-5' exonuclease and polymerase domains
MRYVVWDCETTTKKHLKRTASPFLAENFVVASGWKRKGGTITGEYFGRLKKPFHWFTKLLENTDVLVGQNIKFDLLYALREPQNLEAWMEFVARGGNVWDCQLAEYLLQGMRPSAQMLSMDEMVTLYGGNAKIDEVKALWASGVDTINIDPDLLMRYLCGTVEGDWKESDPANQAHGDIGNTELIFRGQLVKARKTGQMRSIMLNMGSLLCTVEMERNGMCVDKELGMRIAAELRASLDHEVLQLQRYLPQDLPFEFNWSNRYHLSPLIFGGRVKYERRTVTTDENGDPVYYQKDETHYVLNDLAQTETTPYPPFDPLGPPVEYYVRFAGGKNKGEFKTKKVKVPDIARGPKSAMRDFFYEFPRITEPLDEWKSSTEGLWSVAENVIEELGTTDIPFLKSLSSIAKMSKDLGTYYFSVDEKTGEEKGMLTLVGHDGIVHHSINHTRTITARFSSSDPNLQNISKGQMGDDGTLKSGSAVKTTFVSRWRTDGQIVQSDFTALEVYVQAILTLCPALIADLKAGLDMHCVRVSQKEGITYEDALLKCKGDESRGIKPLPEWAKKRTEAKEFSFQRAYGAGAPAIAKSTGMSESDVKALIEAENARYPELGQYNETKAERIKASRRPTSQMEVHPEIPGLMCQFGRGFSVTPDNKLYSYMERPVPKKIFEGQMKRYRGNPKLFPAPSPQNFSPTEIANYEIQGTGGEWAKAAMWLAIRAFYARKNFGGLALLVNQVHDALYGDMHKSVMFEASALLHACMLAASDFMEWWFSWKVPVPVPSVTVHGDNMMQEKGFGKEFEGTAQALRVELRKQYMDGYTPSFLTI